MKYLDYLEKKDDITTTEGESVEVFELKGGMDPETLEEWAISYRQNYCGDDILDLLVKGTGLTKEEYLLTHKFPDKTEGFGPGTRSGDFAELLIADYLEFCLGYTVHRERYKNKFNRSSSTKGPLGVTTMLDKAFEKIPDGTDLILHSDQGWQYQHKQYQRMLQRKGIRQSMSRKGNCLDNAVIENFFGLLKSELLYLQEFESMEHFKQELIEYLDYYNNHRIKTKLKGLPPALHRMQALSVA